MKDGGPLDWGGGSIAGDDAHLGDSAWSPAPADPPPRDAPAGAAADRYAAAGLVGRGGMGHVSVAWDRVLEREVALKIVRPDLAAGAAAAARLANEARVTAALDHPAIVPVYDAGRTPDGEPFYVMRLVRGHALAEAIATRPALEARLGLLRQVLAVCEAVAYAHHHGVVHRDIKPQNAMLGEFGEVQVMDWGLAERVGAEASGGVGTPAYMAPEQAAGGVVSAAWDVWGLGVVLLELVAGAPPRPGEARAELARVAARSGADRPPPELLAVIERCLAPDPADRYTASELALDLEHYLDGRRVGAYDYPLGALLRRALRVWRVPLAVGAVALALLIAVLVVGNTRLKDERDRASASLARVLAAQAESAFEDGDLPRAEAAAADALAIDVVGDDPAARRARASARGVLMARYAAPTLVARHPLPSGCPVPRLAPAGDVLVCAGGGRLAAWSLRPEAASDDVRALRLLWEAVSDAVEARPLPAASRVIAIGRDEELRSYDLRTGQVREQVPWSGTTLAPTERHAVAHNSSRILAHGLAGDVGPPLWHEHPCRDRVQALAVDRDERRVVVACTDLRLLVGQRGVYAMTPAVPTGPAAFGDASPTKLAFGRRAEDADLLAWGDARGRLGLMRVADDGAVTAIWLRSVPASVVGLVFDDAVYAVLEGGGVAIVSRDGDDLAALPRRVATRGLGVAAGGRLVALSDDALTIWQRPAVWTAHRVIVAPSGLTGATPSPDGARLAVATDAGKVVVCGRDGARVAEVSASPELVKPVAWTSDGGAIVGTWMSPECGVQRFDARTWQQLPRLEAGATRRVVTLAGGLVLAVVYGGHSRLYRGDGELAVTGLWDEPLIDASTSADGRVAVLVPEAGAYVALLRADDPGRIERLATTAPTYAADIAIDGRVALARPTSLALRDPATGAEREVEEAGARVLDVAFSPDGALLVGGGDDGAVAVWAAATGELLARIRGHRERVPHVAFFPDGRLFTTTSWDGTVRAWDPAALTAPPMLLAARVAGWGGDGDAR